MVKGKTKRSSADRSRARLKSVFNQFHDRLSRKRAKRAHSRFIPIGSRDFAERVRDWRIYRYEIEFIAFRAIYLGLHLSCTKTEFIPRRTRIRNARLSIGKTKPKTEKGEKGLTEKEEKIFGIEFEIFSAGYCCGEGRQLAGDLRFFMALFFPTGLM